MKITTSASYRASLAPRLEAAIARYMDSSGICGKNCWGCEADRKMAVQSVIEVLQDDGYVIEA